VTVGDTVRVGVAVLVLALSVPSLARPVIGQTLNQAMSSAINQNCTALGAGSGNSAASLRAQGFGSDLAALCADLPSGSLGPGFTSNGGLAGGSITGQTGLGATEEDRRLLLRMKERRDRGQALSGAASADSDRGLGVFVSGEFERFDKDVTRFEPGYGSDTWSGTVALDYLFTSSVLAGLAFNYGNTHGTFDQRGGSFDTVSYGGLLYLSVFPARNFFIDAVAGYAHKDYSVDRQISFTFNRVRDFPATDPRSLVTVTGRAVSNADGPEYRAGLNVGYDFVLGILTIGPRLGVNYKHIDIGHFAEKGRGGTTCFTNAASVPVCTSSNATGLELAYDRQQQDFLRSVVGAYASLAFSTPLGVLLPQTTLEYVHEFLDDKRTIRFRFVEDNAGRTKLRFQTDPPDRDYFLAGVGLALQLPRGIAPFINYRGMFGYSNERSHTVTAGVRFAF
jgi:uncharacterized protein YhjY with autotransporter beta-barrel domain